MRQGHQVGPAVVSRNTLPFSAQRTMPNLSYGLPAASALTPARVPFGSGPFTGILVIIDQIGHE